MRKLVWALLSAARSSLKARRELALENLALRQQLAVLRRPAQRPKLSRAEVKRGVGSCKRPRPRLLPPGRPRASSVALVRPAAREGKRLDWMLEAG
jgi:hypothetical protein